MELLNFYEHWTGVLWPSPRSISCTFDFATAVSFFFNRLVLMYLVVHFLCSNKKCAFCIDCFLFPAVTLVWDLNLHQQPAWLDFELLNFESQSWKSERSATAVLTKHSTASVWTPRSRSANLINGDREYRLERRNTPPGVQEEIFVTDYISQLSEYIHLLNQSILQFLELVC